MHLVKSAQVKKAAKAIFILVSSNALNPSLYRASFMPKVE